MLLSSTVYLIIGSMDMRHSLIIPSLLLLISVCASAQTTASTLQDDLGFYVGAFVPMYKGQESDVVLGITYGHFNSDGLGFRTGFQLTPSIAEIDNAFGIPVALAYRTRSRDSSRRLERGVEAAGTSFGYDVIMGYSTPLQGALAAFLANMFSNMEFFAGITPGYISGESSQVSTASWGQGYMNTDETWTERNGRLSLSLDAGTCFNYRIWRFDLKLSPAFHYNLTRNYIGHTESVRFNDGSDIASVSSSEQAFRWFFTLTGGLSFKF